ncbi:hypothetical protein M8J76_017164 [Diaphorina citri]|nr:hypothetical protein M8J76_017164 [Diaphorina citri]KAI5718675.1 hypothetical protein M8J77_025048 [Diaphorina citri]
MEDREVDEWKEKGREEITMKKEVGKERGGREKDDEEQGGQRKEEEEKPSEVSERPIAVVIWFCLTSKNAAWNGLILVKTRLLLLLFLLLLLLFLFLLLLLLFLFLLLLLLFLFLLLLLLFLFLLLLLLFLFLLLLLKGYNYTNVDTYVHSSLAHQVDLQ